MRKIWIACLLISSSLTLRAQNPSDLPANSFPFNMGGATVKAFDNRYEGVKGTHLFMDVFQPGKIHFKNKNYSGLLLNYDAINDQVLIKKDTAAEAFIMRKDIIESFSLQNNGQFYHFIRLSWDGAQQYFLELVNGKTALYCKVTKSLQRAELGGAYNASENRSDRFVTTNEYYIKKDGGDLQKLSQSKKGINKAFPEKESEISPLLKGKLDFNNYEQVTSLFMEINKIL